MTEAAWRYLAEDGVTASFGLAVDETLAAVAGRAGGASSLRLYTYRSHCALVGRFQNIDAELDLEFCRSADIPMGRRPTGGGAILMGADQLGLALALPAARGRAGYDRARELFARLSSGLVVALESFGVTASFKRKNDLEVDGKKIAGLGVFFHPDGGLLFHASLLVDLDVPLMLRALRTPLDKLADKAAATLAERVTTLRRETRSEVAVEEVRTRVREGYARSLGVQLEPGCLTDTELREVRALEERKYASEEWIQRRGAILDLNGACQIKTQAGLLNVSVTLAGDVIKAVVITGDFFVDEGALATIERCLRWQPARKDAVEATLRQLEGEGTRLTGLSVEVLVEAIGDACRGARPAGAQRLPRGCFVSPGNV